MACFFLLRRAPFQRAAKFNQCQFRKNFRPTAVGIPLTPKGFKSASNFPSPSPPCAHQARMSSSLAQCNNNVGGASLSNGKCHVGKIPRSSLPTYGHDTVSESCLRIAPEGTMGAFSEPHRIMAKSSSSRTKVSSGMDTWDDIR